VAWPLPANRWSTAASPLALTPVFAEAPVGAPFNANVSEPATYFAPECSYVEP
jgi:hypothetical protein